MAPSPPAPAGDAEIRFLTFRDFAIRLGYFTTFVPPALALLFGHVQRDLSRRSILGLACSTLAGLLYPVAIQLHLSRRILPWLLFGTVSAMNVAVIWALPGLPGGIRANLWLLVFPGLISALLSMPFTLRQTALEVAGSLAVPLIARATYAQAFPLLDYYAILVPILVIFAYFKVLLNRLFHQARAQVLEIKALAVHDPLTGLDNRRAFMDTGGRLLGLAARNGHPLGLIMLDIDHFKRINDQFGHAAGDQVLCEAARRMTQALRTTDLVARIGGEEFAMLLPEASPAALAAAAERVRKAFADAPVRLDSQALLPVTASLGTAQLSVGDTLDALLSRADKALYAAKGAGRNRVAEG